MPSPTKYTCKEGDHAGRIAEDKPEIEWSAILKAVQSRGRKDPYMLCPGDVLDLSPEAPKIENEATGKEYSHQLQRSPLVLRLRLLDENHEPYRDCPYTMKIDQEPDIRKDNKPDGQPRKTDGSGVLEEPNIPPKARTAELSVTVPVPIPSEEVHPTPPSNECVDPAPAPEADHCPADPPEEGCSAGEFPEDAPSDNPPQNLSENAPQEEAPHRECQAILTWTLQIGDLRPIADDRETLSTVNIILAVQQRLWSLGYFSGDRNGKTSPVLDEAIRAFREDYCGETRDTMPTKDLIDDKLRQTLAEIHDQG